MDTFHTLHEYDDISIGRLGMHELSEQELDRIAAWIANAPLMRPKTADELARSPVAVLRHGTLIRAFATLSPLPPPMGRVTLVGSVIPNPDTPSRGMARALMTRIAEKIETDLFAVSRCQRFIGLAKSIGFDAYGTDGLAGIMTEMARLSTPDLTGKTFLHRPAKETGNLTYAR